MNNTVTAQSIRDQADATHAQYPQYRGHWDGPEWVLVKMTARTRTKLGVAFERGDVTLAEPAKNYPGCWFAYSVRNTIDTLVVGKKVKVLS